jgi:hypothetical protein
MEYINIWAVLAGAFSYMALGMLWYGPVFGKLWMGLMGFTPENIKQMPLSANQAVALGALNAIIMAFGFSYFVGALGVSTLTGVFMMSVWAWLAFLMPNSAGGFLWEGKPFKLFALNAAHQFVSALLMGAVIVLVS